VVADSTQSPHQLYAPTLPAKGLRHWLPGLNLFASYNRTCLMKDVGAGLVLTTVLVPVGMGYAHACGLPSVYGLYATIAALVTYAIFGPSRILILGPDSSLIAIIAATILPIAARGSDRAILLAGMLAILSGLLCVVAGLARFGFLTDLLSKPVRYGYLNAIALTLIVSQLPQVFGFQIDEHAFVQQSLALAHGIMEQKTNWSSFAIGSTCLIAILAIKRWQPKIPAVLIVVLVATVVAAFFDLSHTCNVQVVGPLPHGLPAFRLPIVSLADIQAIIGGAIVIALVSFADMSVVSRTFAMRGRYVVDDNQEIIALGAANIVSGLFQGFSVSSSMSRTPVAEAAGARTQLTGIIGAVCVGLLLILAPDLLHNVPLAALAAVVISACFSLVEVKNVVRLYKLRRAEFVACLVCFFVVTLIGVVQGILIAVALSLLAFIWRAWRPHSAVLGRVDRLKGYHDISRHPEARQIPGLILFRWDAPLFFANARVFEEAVMKAIGSAQPPVKAVVVAAEPVTDIDSTAADTLCDLVENLRRSHIELCFAELKGPVKDQLKCYGIFERIGVDHFYPTIGKAIDWYIDEHQIEWHDWDELQAK